MIYIFFACVGVDKGSLMTDTSDDDMSQQENETSAEDTADQETTAPQVELSTGCGRAPSHSLGGTQVEVNWQEAGGERGFYLSLPNDYDPDVGHKVVFGFSGTNWVGAQIQNYLSLESHATQTIFVYPDPLWRDFVGWGNYGGWLLGPYAQPAHGEEDIIFVEKILDAIAEQYCVDSQKVFATGHSWGGDMAQVVACFLGERFRASAPVAANRPYWFEDAQGNPIYCSGDTAVWTWFGVNDDHFTWQSYPGEYGDECRDFWLAERGCSQQAQEIQVGSDICYIYEECESEVRYCLYDAQYGHQIPSDYFPQVTMEWFDSF